MAKREVLVFTTGGTIEKSYCEAEGSIKNQESLLREKLLNKLRLPYTDIDPIQIMAKDSLDMTLDDRRRILEFIKLYFKTKRPIIVLHGTDTLENTLAYCHKQMPEPPVPVIFTGAMRPAGFDDSDAQQNFTEALYASQVVGPGFYCSFHGRLFKAPYLTKDRENGTFKISISEPSLED